MKKFLIIIICTITSLGYSQDVHFSQIQESPLWLNPANAGFMNGYLRAIANYRNQWAASGKAYQTMAISADAVVLKIKKNKGYLGLGLFVFNDKAGVAKMGSTQAQIHVNAIIKTSKRSKMAAAVYSGFNQYSANYSVLTFESQFDGKEINKDLGSGEAVTFNSFVNTDAGVGLNYEYSTANIDMLRDDIFSIKFGGAVHHLNKPVQKFASGSSYQLPMRFVGNVQSRIDIKGTKISILPSAIYLRQATASEITLGTHIRYRFKNPTKVTGRRSETGLNIGVYYRLNDAIIPQLNVDMGKYAFGFSYDLNISKYRQVSRLNGGFEVYLKFMSLDDALFKRKREHNLN